MKRWILLILMVFTLVGCRTATDKQARANDKAAQSQLAVIDKQTVIEDKGKAFVYGTRYSLDHVASSNRTTEIEVASRFADLAQLTLGNPSMHDATTIREITDDLLAKSQAETESAKRQVAEGERKLSLFISQIETLTKEKTSLEKQHKDDLENIKKVANSNAEKAQKYDEEHTFWRAINPFYDLGQFFKKLLGWGITITVLILVFSILELVFPELRVVGVVFGWFFKLIAKLFPSVRNAAGVVSNKVYDGFKRVVLGYNEALSVLRDHPIEEGLLEGYPKDKKFDWFEMRALLEKHTEQIIEILRKEQERRQDDDTRAIVQKIKSETGVKQVSTHVRI